MKESLEKKFLNDIELLIAAHDRLLAARERLAKLDASEFVQISTAPKFAAWLYSKGWKTEDEVFAFFKKAWDNYRGNKSQLWVFGGPHEDDPMPEVDRLLDRIDMAMGLIAQRTQTAKPVQSVNDYGWHPDQHLRKILAFAQAANDLG